MVKRGYFVHIVGEDIGIIVIGPSAKYAKRHAFVCELSQHCDWIEVRVIWCKGIDVSDLPMGVLKDEMLGLRRGLYAWLEDGVCDVCGHVGGLVGVNGKAVCFSCEEKE